MTTMSRPITLLAGQWADLPFEEVAKLAAEWGYDGLEIACSGDHLDVVRGAVDDDYVASRRQILNRYGLQVFAISAHLQGQAVCDDPIDERHRGILSGSVWATASRRESAGERPRPSRTPAEPLPGSVSRRWSGSPAHRFGNTSRCSHLPPPR